MGFSLTGQKYLNKIKKNTLLPIVTTFSKGNSDMLKYEQVITSIYTSILPEKEKNILIKQEYQNKPKMREY